VTVYVSVDRESCTFLCAYGLLAEQALLEIYVAVVVETPYNDFETH